MFALSKSVFYLKYMQTFILLDLFEYTTIVTLAFFSSLTCTLWSFKVFIVEELDVLYTL